MQGLQWLDDPSLKVSQTINKENVIFLEVLRQTSCLKRAIFKANLETDRGNKVGLQTQIIYLV